MIGNFAYLAARFQLSFPENGAIESSFSRMGTGERG